LVTNTAILQNYRYLTILVKPAKNYPKTEQKSETKRWEGNYNNLYRQHVQLKRSKGLAIE